MSEVDARTSDVKVQRYKHEFQRNSGSREMVEHDEGEWVKHEDVTLSMIFVTSYLGEHKGMLEDMGAHPKVLAAVQHIIDEIGKL